MIENSLYTHTHTGCVGQVLTDQAEGHLLCGGGTLQQQGSQPHGETQECSRRYVTVVYPRHKSRNCRSFVRSWLLFVVCFLICLSDCLSVCLFVCLFVYTQVFQTWRRLSCFHFVALRTLIPRRFQTGEKGSCAP